MRAEQSWSLLDPKPVLLYISNCDEYIAYWNGVVMPHKMALCMAMEYASGIFPTPEMKTALERDYERLYYSNAFATRAWDLKVCDSQLYPYLKRIMKDHLVKTIQEAERPAAEVLGWFDYSRARKEQNV